VPGAVPRCDRLATGRRIGFCAYHVPGQEAAIASSSSAAAAAAAAAPSLAGGGGRGRGRSKFSPPPFGDDDWQACESAVAALTAASSTTGALAAMKEVDILAAKGKAWVAHLVNSGVCTVMVSTLQKFRQNNELLKYVRAVAGKVAVLGSFSQELLSAGLRIALQAY